MIETILYVVGTEPAEDPELQSSLVLLLTNSYLLLFVRTDTVIHTQVLWSSLTRQGSCKSIYFFRYTQ